MQADVVRVFRLLCLHLIYTRKRASLSLSLSYSLSIPDYGFALYQLSETCLFRKPWTRGRVAAIYAVSVEHDTLVQFRRGALGLREHDIPFPGFHGCL